MLLAGNYLSLLTVTLINFETWGLVSSLKDKKKNLKNVENASKGVSKAFIQNLFLSNKKKKITSFCRATTNNKVREQVLLELSFVNSDLQILKEELEGLNISVEVYQNTE